MAYDQKELRRQVAELLKRPENKECADCTERMPKWAVVNHGIFVCLNCSGQHRNIGAHISKVKSATLDDWTPQEVAFMASMGNQKANAILLANLPPGMSKPQSSDDRGRERWIKQKYAQRKWAGTPNAQTTTPDQAPAQPQMQQQPQQQQYQQYQQYQTKPVQQYQYQPQQMPQQQNTQAFSTFTPAPVQYQQQTQQVRQQTQAPPAQAFDLFSTLQNKPQTQTQQPRQQFNQSYTAPAQPAFQPRMQQPQPQFQPQQQPQQSGMLIDFGFSTVPQPKPIDPNAGAQLMSCFGQTTQNNNRGGW